LESRKTKRSEPDHFESCMITIMTW